MDCLNVTEWSPAQVEGWLRGLDAPVCGYATGLRARGLDGAKLLMLRCDDLEHLGMRTIGHQELLLEAVEHLRNFQYETSRECVQQMALRVSVAATGLSRALAGGCERLETQALMDVARAVAAVKALVWWLARFPLAGLALRERAAELLALCLEAATCAQRDRFAEQPARSVHTAAKAAAAVADHIVQHVSDSFVLAPASLETVSLRQAGKPLGFSVLPSLGGHLQLAAIRFGSPAHASGAVHEGDEVVQVGAQCVVGWSGAAVEAACAERARGGGELLLRLRRRGARVCVQARRDRRATRLQPLEAGGGLAPPAPAPAPGDSSDEEPASPTLPLDRRMYPPPPRALTARRHSVSGGSPTARRPRRGLEQFWCELQQARWRASGPIVDLLYRRDKAVSCSTGLELSPRPLTCPAPAAGAPEPAGGLAGHAALAGHAGHAERARGKLDKSHSTPAYDFDAEPPGPLVHQVIPESPTTPADADSPTVLVHSAEKADQILDFKKSSSQIEEAILHKRRLTDERNEFSFGEGEGGGGGAPAEAVNTALEAAARVRRLSAKTPPQEERSLSVSEAVRSIQERGAASPAAPPRYPALRPVPPEPAPTSPPRPHRIDVSQISVPLRHLTRHELRVPGRAGAGPPGSGLPGPRPEAPAAAATPTRGIFPTYKSKSLKKKNSLLAKRRGVAARALAGGAGGPVWQRVRARAQQQARWARRYLLLNDTTLYAYRSADGARADCMIQLAGFTAAAAGEVKSRPHAFKVYHHGTAFYFACDSADATRAWLDLITRATTLHPAPPPLSADLPKQYSETDYSTDSDMEAERPRDRERDRSRERDAKDKDKSKFGSLKKLTHRMQRSESTETVGAGAGAGATAASLDRKYLRFFSRSKHKDDKKSKQSLVPVPTEHYRSYRRVSQPQHEPASSPSPASLSSAAPPPLAGPLLAPPAPPRKPHNYMHASNPNLLEFGNNDIVSPRMLVARPAPPSLSGFVTLEEFMLQKQEEDAREPYSDRVLLGVQRGGGGGGAGGGGSLRRRLDLVVPDVLYGTSRLDPDPHGPESSPSTPPRVSHVPHAAHAAHAAHVPHAPHLGHAAHVQARSLPRTPPQRAAAPGARDLKPISVKGKDGYEKIVYTDAAPAHGGGGGERMRRPSPPPEREREAPAPAPLPAPLSAPLPAPALGWRDSLRRHDKGGGGGGARRVAPLQASPVSVADSSVSPGAGAGVSRLRLMFGRARQESAMPGSAAAPPAGAGAGPPGEWAWRTHHYPHLQCPPTFVPETYSLAAAARHPRPPPPRD